MFPLNATKIQLIVSKRSSFSDIERGCRRHAEEFQSSRRKTPHKQQNNYFPVLNL